jgi:hypothetical protein
MNPSDESETYTEAETKARAEAALKRMLATPHKPHKAPKPKEKPAR